MLVFYKLSGLEVEKLGEKLVGRKKII